MQANLEGVINALAEAISQKKIKEEASVGVAVITLNGRNYQVQTTLEPMKSKYLPVGKVVGDDQSVIVDVDELFSEEEKLKAAQFDDVSDELKLRLSKLISLGYRLKPKGMNGLISPEGAGLTFEEIAEMTEDHFGDILNGKPEVKEAKPEEKRSMKVVKD